jgi:imidazolonepropionase-like amidohydrolase
MEFGTDQAGGPRQRLTRRKLLKRLGLATAGAVTIPAAAGVAFYAGTRYRAGDPQTGHLALVGATVLVGEDLAPRTDTTVLIRDGVITEVGDDAAITAPAGADSIDLSGQTLMPGLIDLHVHLGAPGAPAGERRGPLSMPKMIADWVRLFPDRRRALLEH